MSAVWVRLDEAQRGSLPARSARTGARCVTRYRRPAHALPPSLEWATWTGAAGRGADVPIVVLPLLPRQHRIDSGLRRARDGSAALLVVCLMAMVLVEGGVGRAAGWLGVAAAVVHVVVGLAGFLVTVHLRLDDTGRWVRLSNVHREFATAAEAVTTRPTTEPTPVPLITPRPDVSPDPAGDAVEQ